VKTITKEAQFYELFHEAVRVFEENTLASRYRMTIEQSKALRELSEKYEVAFEPHDYLPLITRPGSFAGRVGGARHSDNPYVSVSPDGEDRFS
jgi:hypothetical protein